MDSEDVLDTISQNALPVAALTAAGGLTGLLPGNSGLRRGAMRGAGVAGGALAGNALAKLLSEKLGLSEGASGIASLLGTALGGYGGYKGVRHLTKTAPEDVYDQMYDREKAMGKMASATPEGMSDGTKNLLLTLGIATLAPSVLGAAVGGVGGAVSPRGSGLLPGAFRGAAAGGGAMLGGLAGNTIASAFDASPAIRALSGLAGTALGGGLGYSLGKKMTKTQKEDLDEAMLDYYQNRQAAPSFTPAQLS